MTLSVAVLLLAQIAQGPAEPAPPNLVPASTEDPVATLISDNPRVVLTKLDISPSEEFLRRVRAGSTMGLSESQVCATPCNVKVPSADLYRVNGDGVTSSRIFTLPRGERAVVNVKSGSSTVAGVSAAILVASALALGAGATMVATGDDLVIPGLATLGGGVALTTTGVLLMNWRGVTRVDVKGDEPVARPPPP